MQNVENGCLQVAEWVRIPALFGQSGKIKIYNFR
jgi:hypothetical protein